MATNQALVPLVEEDALELERDSPGLGRVEKNPVASYLARLRPGSRRTQYGALRWISATLRNADPRKERPESFAWWLLGYVNVQLLRGKLEEEFSFATANRYLAALKGVLRETWRLGLIDAEQLARATDFKPIAGQRLLSGREMSLSEIKSLFAACATDKTALGRRDEAMLAMLRYCGLRRHEVVTALIEKYDPDDGSLRVVGKGNKEREVYLGNGQRYVDTWLGLRPASRTGPIVTHISGAALTPQSVFVVLRKRASAAGLDPTSFSAHDFRRTFISDLLGKGVDISTVQQIVGHSNTSTTQGYDRRGRGTKIAAVDLLE